MSVCVYVCVSVCMCVRVFKFKKLCKTNYL